MKPAPFTYHAPDTVDEARRAARRARRRGQGPRRRAEPGAAAGDAARRGRAPRRRRPDRRSCSGHRRRERHARRSRAATRDAVLERDADGGRGGAAAGQGDTAHRALPDPQPGHGRRLARARRPGRRVPGGRAGPRRASSSWRRCAGTRRVPAADFFQGVWTTSLAPDEVLTAVHFPVWAGRCGFAVRGVRAAGTATSRSPARSPRSQLDDDGAVDRAARSRCSGWADAAARPRRRAGAGRQPAGRAPTRRRSGSSRWPTSRAARRPARAGGVPAAGGRGDGRARPGPSRRGGRRRRMPESTVRMTVNGGARSGRVEHRRTLADFVREDCGLTGTHLGCEHGVCGACTVLVDGEAVRSCLMFAVQADGAEVTTVEGIGAADGRARPGAGGLPGRPRAAVRLLHPGLRGDRVTAFLRDNPDPTDAEIRDGLSGNLCRCTGYQGIVEAVRRRARSDMSERSIRRDRDRPRSPLRRAARAPTRGPPAAHRPRQLRRRRRPARDAARRVRPQRRRPRAHRRDRQQRTPARWTGVVAVLTAADLNAEVHASWVDYHRHPPVDQPCSACWPNGDVRFVGDPVAVVLAESRYVAEDACALVDVEIEAEPAVVDVDAALAEDAPAWCTPSSAPTSPARCRAPTTRSSTPIFAGAAPRRDRRRSPSTATCARRWRRRGIVAALGPAPTG